MTASPTRPETPRYARITCAQPMHCLYGDMAQSNAPNSRPHRSLADVVSGRRAANWADTPAFRLLALLGLYLFPALAQTVSAQTPAPAAPPSPLSVPTEVNTDQYRPAPGPIVQGDTRPGASGRKAGQRRQPFSGHSLRRAPGGRAALEGSATCHGLAGSPGRLAPGKCPARSGPTPSRAIPTAPSAAARIAYI